eukprot:3875493-Alexandrium_andersonii.AAC.1
MALLCPSVLSPSVHPCWPPVVCLFNGALFPPDLFCSRFRPACCQRGLELLSACFPRYAGS